jgi:hypothetical protein
MGSKVLCALIMFSVAFNSYSFETNSFNKDSVYTKAVEYTNLLTDYSNCKGDNWRIKMENIVSLFGQPNDVNQEYPHAYDLFNSFEDEDNTNKSVSGYLFAIHDFYDNDLIVEFSKITVTDCTIGDLVLVSAEKKLSSGKLSKTIPIIIDIDVSTMPYTLRSVQLLSKEDIEECNTIKSIANKKLISKITIESSQDKKYIPSLNIEEQKYFNYYISIADEKFKSKAYNKAKKYYMKSLEYQANSSYAEIMIKMCESILIELPSSNYISPNLSIGYSFPTLLKAGKIYYASIVYNYNNNLVGQEAIHEINLPDGCIVSSNSSDIQGAIVESYNRKIKFIWEKLPNKTPFIITYKVQVSPSISTPISGKLTGSFSYMENGTMTIKDFDNDF